MRSECSGWFPLFLSYIEIVLTKSVLTLRNCSNRPRLCSYNNIALVKSIEKPALWQSGRCCDVMRLSFFLDATADVNPITILFGLVCADISELYTLVKA